MSTDQDNPKEVRTLNGWKEIAQYLSISVRSAQRAEADEALPVHRLSDRIVYAYRAELDDWRRGSTLRLALREEQPIDEEFVAPAGGLAWRKFRQRIVILIAALGAVLLGAAAGRPRPAEATHFRLIGRSLEGLDSRGRIAWTYSFDMDVSPVTTPSGTIPIEEIDIDGDGENEVLVPAKSSVDGVRTTISDAVHLFTRHGVRKWTIRPDQTLKFGEHSFGAPWGLRAVRVSPDPADRRIWMVFAHHTWWPGFVVEVTPKGEASVKYVQDGRIEDIEYVRHAGGGYLIAAGVSHRLAEGVVVFLRDGQPASTFPNDGDRQYDCAICPQNMPDQVVTFPASETTRDRSPFNWISRMSVTSDNAVSAVISDYSDASTVRFERVFESATIYISDRRWDIHREMERAGRINHSVADCPERGAPRRVRTWTRSGDWTEAMVATKESNSE